MPSSPRSRSIFPQEGLWVHHPFLTLSQILPAITVKEKERIEPQTEKELRAVAPNTLRLIQSRVSIVTSPLFRTGQVPNISWTARAEFMHRAPSRRGCLGALLLKYNSFGSQAGRCCSVSGNYTAQAKGKHIFFLLSKARQTSFKRIAPQWGMSQHQ